MNSHLLCLATLCVVGCGQSDPPAVSIPDQYQFLSGAAIAYQDMPAIRARLPYEKIQLEVFST